MLINFDELMKQEEMYIENLRKADEWYMEVLRERTFPTPSPFGIEWEKQRLIEAYNMIARWSEGRKDEGYELQVFKQESLRIMLVVLESM
jgi:hypothetical protein